MRLHRQPDGRNAWFWRVRVKVLSYFITVYGDAEQSTDALAPRRFATVGQTRSPDIRKRAKIRVLLGDIAAANAPSHSRAARENLSG